jgi:enoyl-CoA hydratase/carnithine racemase
VVLSRAGSVVNLRFNHPKSYNALSEKLVLETEAAFHEAGADSSVSALVVTGTGKYFTSGADLATILQPGLPKTIVANIEKKNKVDGWLQQCAPLELESPGEPSLLSTDHLVTMAVAPCSTNVAASLRHVD